MAEPRLLEVVPYYEPAWTFGGPPRVMSDEAKEMVRRGWHVAVFTTDAFEADHRLPSGTEILDGVAVTRFANVSNSAAFHRYRFQPRGMAGALESVNADVIHLSELRHELAVLSWRATRKRGIPLVVSAHGTLPRRDGWKGRLRGIYDRALVTPMLEGSALLIAQTHHECELYRTAGAADHQVELVPLGLGPAPPIGTGRLPDLGVPDDAEVVLFLGRIHPLKGVNRLIEAFADANTSGDVWLVIAGRDDGGLGAARELAARRGVANRVSFPGPIYGADRFEAYRRATLFAITPTHFEETSLASLEAASVGTPLLLSSQAEAPFLAEYDAGRTVGAEENPAKALGELLGTDLGAKGRNALRMIEERHWWTSVGEQLDQSFRKVTS